MIEINLLPKKRPFKMPVILGMDLTLLNIKMIILAIIVHVSLTPYFVSDWSTNSTMEEDLVNRLERDFRKKVRDGQASRDILAQIEILKAQQQKLEAKLKIVNEIIKIKKNPLGILMFLAKKIPADVWISVLSLENDTIILEGSSDNYRSIGIFIENLQGSVFFGNTIKLLDSKTSQVGDEKKRLENFKISATIERYE